MTILFLWFLPVAAHAQYGYKLNADDTVTITNYTGAGGDVVIPSNIVGKTVSSIGTNAFSGIASLKSVTIPDCVTTLERRAFYHCTSLTNIILGSGVIRIGESSLQQCTNLTRVVMGSNVASIGVLAFANCEVLPNITISSNATSIGQSAFERCYDLKSVAIPNSVINMGNRAFYGCRSLKSIVIGNNVTSIGSETFLGCLNLTNVIIGSSVTSIGGDAFNNCQGLINIVVPSSVTSIMYRAFSNCSGLINAVIGHRVANIGYSAFSGCNTLLGAYFSGNAPIYGTNVFSGCTLATVYYLSETTGWPTVPGKWPTGDPTGRPTAHTALAISPASTNVPNTTLSGLIIGVTGNAPWTAATNQPWIIITSGASGSTNDSIIYSVATNAGISSRTGRIVVAGGGLSRTCTVTQAGVPETRIIGLIGNSAFGNVVTGLTATTTMTITNSGNSTLTVSGIGYPAGFSGAWNGSIAAGMSTNVTVMFRPVAVTKYEGTAVVSNNATSGTNTISVSGTGMAAQPEVNGEVNFGIISNRFGFDIIWATGQTVVVDASTNLTTTDWVPVVTNTLTNGTFYFSDPEWTNLPGRFYRLRSLP